MIGFFLATLLVSSFTYVQLKPYSEEINKVYEMSHNDWYNSANSFLDKVGSISDIPLVGNIPYVNSASDMANSISNFMANAKKFSSISYMALKYSLPAILISGLMVIIGIGLAAGNKEKNKSESTKDNSKGEKSKVDRFCSECGEGLSEDDKFCPSCGTEVDN